MTDNIEPILAYIDGACKGNPGIGGWGVYFKYKNNSKELYGGSKYTTNNIMELTSAIEALSYFNNKCKIEIITDSEYLRKGITEWIKKWEMNNWKNSRKEEIKNKELWIKLNELNKKHIVEWKWVKSHSGNIGNEKADELANKGCLNIK